MGLIPVASDCIQERTRRARRGVLNAAELDDASPKTGCADAPDLRGHVLNDASTNGSAAALFLDVISKLETEQN